MTPGLAWAIPPDVKCVLGQWRGAARSHAGRPCLPKLPQRAWPEGFCQHHYQSYSLPVSFSLSLPLFHFSFTPSFTPFPFCTLFQPLCFSVLLFAFCFSSHFFFFSPLRLSTLAASFFHFHAQLKHLFSFNLTFAV